MPTPPLLTQTTYAELLQRSEIAAFEQAFPEEGSFVPKLDKGRRYWYFQFRESDARKQRYVGPETPELLDRIAAHRQARQDYKERRSLVSTLIRSAGMPAPIRPAGEVIEALARQGVFRLRAVLVGTLAYQCYPAMLGLKLPHMLLQTNDVDLAQFTQVSIAVGEQMPPMRDMLRQVDASFRELPSMRDRQGAVSYVAKGDLKVEFLTPNRGPDTDEPMELPALKTRAQPLRFLDYLIYRAVPAVLLHGAGVLVNVPLPERFAVHKLILSRRRSVATAKADKDLGQAAALIGVLAEHRPEDLREALEEASERGPTWRQLLEAGRARLPEKIRLQLESVAPATQHG
jgi:hypothetical protein